MVCYTSSIMPDTKPKVLVVEDDPFMTTLLSGELVKNGFEVFSAVDGEMAVAKFKEIRPDVMIFDILLPKKDGIEALREVRIVEGGNKTPAVVLSNLEESTYVSEAQRLGAKSYLVKANVQLTEIVAKVKEALEAK